MCCCWQLRPEDNTVAKISTTTTTTTTTTTAARGWCRLGPDLYLLCTYIGYVYLQCTSTIHIYMCTYFLYLGAMSGSSQFWSNVPQMTHSHPRDVHENLSSIKTIKHISLDMSEILEIGRNVKHQSISAI